MRLIRSLLTLSLCVAAAPAARANLVVVTQSGFGFSPQNVTIHLGDSVKWVWTGGTHTVSEGTDGVINGNEAFTAPLDSTHPNFLFAFDSTFVAANPRPGGLYNYFCAFHFSIGMVGTVTVDPSTAFCPGDGTGTACPCGNSSPVGANAGCLNSLGSGGKLTAAGVPSVAADSVVLTGTGMPDSSALYFQGTGLVAAGAGGVFGDGLRCAGGTVIRLGTKTNAGGTSSYPTGADPLISVKGVVSPGDVRRYQVWYRNAAAFCTVSTFNLTNGAEITWGA